MRNFASLLRLKVSLMVAVSTAFGYLLARPVHSVLYTVPVAGGVSGAANFSSTVLWQDLFLVSLASLLLTVACSAFNQVQERDTDACFRRTKQRPLVTGQLAVWQAVVVGCCAGMLGLGLFWLLHVAVQTAWLLTGAGLFIFASYNLVYTPLKRRTPFALLIGAFPGAMPPVIGWLATGDGMNSPVIWLVYAVYYLWQVPHFWLRAEQDRHEYAKAELPIPCLVFGIDRYARLLRLWFYAYLIALLMLPVFPLMQSTTARVLLTVCAVGMMLCGGMLLPQRKLAFHAVNISLLAAIVLLGADSMGML